MRQCVRCGTPIEGCMGFVLARDFLAVLEGKIPPESVREICGKCALFFLLFSK
jgi:hypothetical protein